MTAKTLLFVDVETTGLTHQDRVISLGLVVLDLAQNQASMRHLIFNPGRPSNPFARAVHGYDDWTLRHQPDFTDHAEDLLTPFENASRIFAHNAAFDERFLRTEFGQAGLSLGPRRFECTMKAYKAQHGRPGGLDRVLDHMGLAARGKQHGALEDAWLCMRVHLWLNDLPCPAESEELRAIPENWQEPVEQPIRGARPIRSARQGLL